MWGSTIVTSNGRRSKQNNVMVDRLVALGLTILAAANITTKETRKNNQAAFVKKIYMGQPSHIITIS